MKRITGVIENRDGGRVRLHQVEKRHYVEFRSDEPVGWDLASTSPAFCEWTFAFRDSSETIEGELSEAEWTSLFVHKNSPLIGRPSTVHDSHCGCPSHGVSHGVCCE